MLWATQWGKKKWQVFREEMFRLWKVIWLKQQFIPMYFCPTFWKRNIGRDSSKNWNWYNCCKKPVWQLRLNKCMNPNHEPILCISNQNHSHTWKRSLHTHVHHSIVKKSQEKETAQVSGKNWTKELWDV